MLPPQPVESLPGKGWMVRSWMGVEMGKGLGKTGWKQRWDKRLEEQGGNGDGISVWKSGMEMEME